MRVFSLLPCLSLRPSLMYLPEQTAQTPLEKAHAARAAKKTKREEIKTRRLAALKKARGKKAAMK